MKDEVFNEAIDSDWMACPICGFRDCTIYTKGKNKGLFRCYECSIRWVRPMIVNKLR